MQKSAKIVTAVVLAAFVVMFFGITSHNMLIAMGGFLLAFVTVFVAATIQGKNKGAGGAKSGITVNTTQLNKYMPLLMDERTKQHPEIQVLLQYPAVQKAFFDPSSLSSSTVAGDPHVQELFLVFDEMLAQGVINDNIYGNLPNQAQNYPQNTINPANPYQIPKNGSEDKKTIRKAGKIMRFVGIGMFVLPFGLVFALVGLNPGAPWTGTAISIVVSGACPMGMLLIIVGTVLGR